MSEKKEGYIFEAGEVSNDISQRLEVVGQLVSGIAHEINTPIQYVGDNIRYVSKEIDKLINLIDKYRCLGELIRTDKRVMEHVQAIQSFSEENELEHLIDDIPSALNETIEGVEAIAGIVGSLKALIHPGGKEKVETDVNECINNVIKVSKGEWKKFAELEVSLAENLPQVYCYPGELNQVLLNLVVNAAHAIADTDKQGSIKITSFLYKESVGIIVEDTGTGIPITIQHRVFDPFFTSKDVGKGTGQGLAFAHKSVVERSNGTLFFETTEGEGTAFHIYLPCSPD